MKSGRATHVCRLASHGRHVEEQASTSRPSNTPRQTALEPKVLDPVVSVQHED